MREPVDTPRYLLDFDIHLILSIYCSQKIEVGSVVRSLVLDILTEPAKPSHADRDLLRPCVFPIKREPLIVLLGIHVARSLSVS